MDTPKVAQTDLLACAMQFIDIAMDEKGVNPAYCFGLCPGKAPDKSLGVTIVCVMDETGIVYEAAHRLIELESAVEVVFYIDRFALPDQQIITTDFLSLYHWKTGSPWRYGVVPYVPPPEKHIHPIDWDHPVWKPILLYEHIRWAAKERPLTIRLKKVDGTEDLLGLEGLRPSRAETAELMDRVKAILGD